MMRPYSAFTALLVIAFLLILTPVTIQLQQGSVDGKLVWAFVLVAVAIVLIGNWMLSTTDVVRTVRPYRRLGIGTTIFVLGVLLILGTITALLMNVEFADPLLIGLESEPIRLPGLPKLLPLVGVLLMLLGLWINQSDKYHIKLPKHGQR